MNAALNALAQEYALHLIHWWWQTTLVSAAALALVRLAPRSSPRFRGSVLSLALWKLFLPPMLPSPTGAFSRFTVGATGWLAIAPGAVMAAVMGFALVHAAGAAWRLGAVWRAARRLRSPARRTRRCGRLRLAVAGAGDPIATPAVYGWWRPTVVLPAAVAAAPRPQRRLVLAHERRHLERLHGLLLVIEEVLAALGWLQPFFRRVVQEHRRVREELCDAEAVARLDVPAGEYAAGLLAVAGLCGGREAPAGALAATATAASLRRRIAALGRRSRWCLSELAVAVLLWAALLPGIRPWPAPPPSGPDAGVGHPHAHPMRPHAPHPTGPAGPGTALVPPL